MKTNQIIYSLLAAIGVFALFSYLNKNKGTKNISSEQEFSNADGLSQQEKVDELYKRFAYLVVNKKQDVVNAMRESGINVTIDNTDEQITKKYIDGLFANNQNMIRIIAKMMYDLSNKKQ